MVPKRPYLLLTLASFYVNILRTTGIQVNVALNKPTNQSGTLEYPKHTGEMWQSATSVNGKTSCSTPSSSSYSATSITNNPWWLVDLGRVFNITRIDIYGKQNKEHKAQYDGYILYVITVDNQSIRVNNATNTDTSNVSFDRITGTMIGRYVKLQSPNNTADILVLCEVEVYTEAINIAPLAALNASTKLSYGGFDYKKANAVDGRLPGDPDTCSCCYCSAQMTNPFFNATFSSYYEINRIDLQGRVSIRENTILSNVKAYLDGHPFNASFNEHNGNAVIITNNALIRRVSIMRPVVRQSSWYLMICELNILTAVCINGFYGPKCASRCGHCTNGSCDRITGICSDGCIAGYKQPLCDVCASDVYGLNCTQTCGRCFHNNNLCNNVDGQCLNGCDPGYQPPLCQNACASGVYGLNCTQKCGRCFHNNNLCNNVDGHCLNGCDPGYQPPLCQKACASGVYGLNCTQKCGRCFHNNNLCNNVDGHCLNGCDPGYQPPLCQKACASGVYGLNCTQKCGRCFHNNNLCNNVDGHCLNGCDPGYQPPLCQKECYHGTYGNNCSMACHCKDGVNCTNVHGKCPDGLCDPGWQGQSCSEECDHGTFGYNCSMKCHCKDDANCTNNIGRCPEELCAPGWKGKSCEEECDHGTYGDNCYVHCHCKDDAKCTNDNGYCPGGLCAVGWHGISCSEECDHGTFGDNCSMTCHCKDGANCTKDVGHCPEGLCAPGWKGQSCEKECDFGTYGNNCSVKCHCKDDANCTYDNGYCPGGLCAAGWHGISCSKECDHGTYGDNCSNQCHCKDDANCTNDNGYCPGGLCAAGWQGLSCSEWCIHGKYGYKCSLACHCKNATDCTKDKGLCPNESCAPGWKGKSCSNQCDHGTYGQECSISCYCKNNSTCTNENGRCPDGLCAPGWLGQSCNNACDHGKFGDNCSMTCHCQNDTNCRNHDGECPQQLCASAWEGSSCSTKKLGKSNNNSTIPAVVGSLGAILVVAIAIVVFIKRKNISFRSKHTSDTDVKLEVSNIEPKMPSTRSALAEAQTDSSACELNDGYTDDDHAYYSFSPTKFDIKPFQLWHYIREKQQDDCKAFFEEFETLPYGLKCPYNEAMRPANRQKNRYREMYAYDHSRVVLQVTGPGETDYINANYIHGFEKSKKFIASQGPTDKMINDFWRMIWQQKATKIVMLTNCMENGAKKCEKYWPDEEEVTEYGLVHVKVLKTYIHTDYNQREIEMKVDNEPARIVTQFHFKSWPDKDVPDSSWCLANFWRTVSNDQNIQDDAPIVVHCSAGIGRTGTYIALDYLYNQLQKGGVVCPLKAVECLRRQRVNMVQTREQYAYLHEVVADAIGMGTHFIWTSQFEDFYDFMTQHGPGSSTSPLEKQFDLVVESLIDNKDQPTSDVVSTDDIYTNADVAMEIDAYRPHIKKRSSKLVQEMGAMYLPGYNGASVYLVAKSPTEKSLVEFWSLVHEENIKTVISLCESTAKNYKACTQLGADSNALSGMFNVHSLGAKINRAHTTRTFVYSEHGKKEDENRTTVNVFDYSAWKSGYNTPAEAMSMLELLEAVTSWQPHASESQPILVHCCNGTRRSGLVCLILSELQRLRREDGHLNPLDSLIRIKQRNEQIIGNAGQYQFCFDVIRMFLQRQETPSENEYANL